MIKIDVNDHNAKDFARRLQRLGGQSKYLVAKTLNNVAFDVRGRIWPSEIRETMKLRVPYTLRSLRVDRATASQHVAVVGSVAEYMKDQEFGEVKAKKGRHGVALPAAAPGARKTRGRVSKRNWMSNIALQRGQGGRSRKQRNAIALKMARKKGGGVVYLDLGSRRGLFRVGSGKGMPRKVWDLSKSSVTVPKNPTLHAATQRARKNMERAWSRVYGAEVARMLRRIR